MFFLPLAFANRSRRGTVKCDTLFAEIILKTRRPLLLPVAFLFVSVWKGIKPNSLSKSHGQDKTNSKEEYRGKGPEEANDYRPTIPTTPTTTILPSTNELSLSSGLVFFFFPFPLFSFLIFSIQQRRVQFDHKDVKTICDKIADGSEGDKVQLGVR